MTLSPGDDQNPCLLIEFRWNVLVLVAKGSVDVRDEPESATVGLFDDILSPEPERFRRDKIIIFLEEVWRSEAP